MSDDSLRGKLPPVYAPLFSELFDRPVAPESRATCDDCAMCDKGTGELVAASYFQPDLKCCTFHPHLANYLVGAVLADKGDELAEGRARLEKKIAARIGVTPYYISAPRKFNVLYDAARDGGFFGRTDALLCPYFDKANGGRCTVWRYRESICSTFFCKYDRGVKALAFWSTLKDYLSVTEFLLARDASMKVDASLEEPKIDRKALTIEDLEDRAPDDYARIWGKWVGREKEFYIECYKRVRALRRRDFRAIVDDVPEVKKRLELLRQRYEALDSREIPTHLMRNPNLRPVFAGDRVAVTPYNRMDSFALDKDLYDLLGTIRGDQTLEANLTRLADEEDVELAPELVEALYIQGVLKPPPPGVVRPAAGADADANASADADADARADADAGARADADADAGADADADASDANDAGSDAD